LELNWTTFVLEIINFMVLVWILKRFFYRPVQAVIARRRSAIEKELTDAKAIRDEATSIEQQYKNRLSDWEKEREAARQELHGQIEAERVRLKDALTAELKQEREKAKVLDQRLLDEARKEADAAALAQAGQFIRRLLQDMAGPETEARITGLVEKELASLPKESREALVAAWADNHEDIVVQSAFAIAKDRQKALGSAFRQLLGPSDAPWKFTVNPELIAGLHISIGAWTLAANLRDEMRFFMDASNEKD
jgi:F-type H+-transporting ATPase subunit b